MRLFIWLCIGSFLVELGLFGIGFAFHPYHEWPFLLIFPTMWLSMMLSGNVHSIGTIPAITAIIAMALVYAIILWPIVRIASRARGSISRRRAMRRGTCVKSAIALALLLSSAHSVYPAELGTICISPVPQKPTLTFVPPAAPCDGAKLALKIDQQRPIPWPLKGSRKIDGLDVTVSHRILVLCDGKAQQSFTFRFSDFRGRELCLFINDLYKTVQLWDPTQRPAPWCKCK